MAEEFLERAFRLRYPRHTLTIILHRYGMIDTLESAYCCDCTLGLREPQSVLLVVFFCIFVSSLGGRWRAGAEDGLERELRLFIEEDEENYVHAEEDRAPPV